ncbi:FAD-dependent oxidoreductase [Sinorhizobium meliloti]|nr:FAD-dependent oxidoreductase [Sinorhizobium meliloti]WKL40917.1 FAD-dependent oxidoreductase [Sinorhizobium meliloti]
MHQENMVIVGCGHAGVRAAQALRTNGWHGGITLVDGEGRTPYERPPLSKAVLKGESEAEDAPLFPADFLAKNDIHVLKGGRGRGDRSADEATATVGWRLHRLSPSPAGDRSGAAQPDRGGCRPAR